MQARSQQGLTLIGWLLSVGTILVFAWTGMRLFEIHYEHLKIKSALEMLKEVKYITDAVHNDEEGIRKRLRDKLYADSVDQKSLDHYEKLFKIENREGEIQVSIDYEIRRALFGRYDLLGRYRDEVVIKAR